MFRTDLWFRAQFPITDVDCEMRISLRFSAHSCSNRIVKIKHSHGFYKFGSSSHKWRAHMYYCVVGTEVISCTIDHTKSFPRLSTHLASVHFADVKEESLIFPVEL